MSSCDVDVLSEFTESLKDRAAECEAALSTPLSQGALNKARLNKDGLVSLARKVVNLQKVPNDIQSLPLVDPEIRIVLIGDWATFIYERPGKAYFTRLFRGEQIDKAGIEFILTTLRAELARWHS